MMLYLELILVFFFIGMFCFGGGYGVLPFIQGEVIARGWMEAQEFINIIAVSESTPGPLGINVATYVGYKMGGLLGAACATMGLMLPALLLVIVAIRILQTPRGSALWNRFTTGIRPVVVGLILYAAYNIAKSELFFRSPDGISVAWLSVGLAIIGFIGVYKWKAHPALLIGIAAVLGAICAV